MRTAYVTGADRGLGVSLVRALLQRGTTVFAGQFMPNWQELDDLKVQYPKHLSVLSLDVTNESSVNDAASHIRQSVGKLDVLINNAGLFRDRSGNILETLYFDDMMRLYDTNCLGPLRVTHSVMPLLQSGEQKLIVNISSEAGSIGQCWRDKEYGYSMSKAALNMQSTILQNHVKAFGIKVLVVHPGYVRSYMLGHFNQDATVESDDSAAVILRLMNTHHTADSPMYVDYQGNPLVW